VSTLMLCPWSGVLNVRHLSIEATSSDAVRMDRRPLFHYRVLSGYPVIRPESTASVAGVLHLRPVRGVADLLPGGRPRSITLHTFHNRTYSSCYCYEKGCSEDLLRKICCGESLKRRDYQRLSRPGGVPKTSPSRPCDYRAPGDALGAGVITFSLRSSNQFSTTLIWVAVGSCSLALIIRNRCPSGLTS
jgi:hypothetical protein